MVDVSLPAGTLGFLLDPITKFLFLDTYRISHEEHLKRFQAGKSFEELGQFFEFDIHLECNHISNSTIPMSFIILRNKSDRRFERAELLVEADAGYVKYQDFTTLIEIGETPLVINLPRIPLKEIEFTNNDRIITTYKSAKVKLHILDQALPEHEAKSESHSIRPTYTEFLNSRWDRKWDTVWNLDYIENCKSKLRQKIQFYLVTRNKWPVSGEPQGRIFKVYKLLRLLIGIPIYKLLSYDRIISTLFWLPIFMRIKKLEPRKNG